MYGVAIAVAVQERMRSRMQLCMRKRMRILGRLAGGGCSDARAGAMSYAAYAAAYQVRMRHDARAGAMRYADH